MLYEILSPVPNQWDGLRSGLHCDILGSGEKKMFILMEKPWMVYPIGILMFPLFSMWCHICYTHYMVSLYMMLIQWYPPWIYIYTYIHIPYSNDIPHYSYIIHPYLFHPVISVIIVYSQHSHTPSTQKWRLPTSWTVRWTPRAAMAAAMALCTARWPTACDPTRGIGRNGEEFHPGKHPFCIH